MTWLRTIGKAEAGIELRDVYEQMRRRPMPAAYVPPHGDAPGIIRAHSLDPKLIGFVFGGMSASLARDPLTWPQRELVNATTSRLNQCLY